MCLLVSFSVINGSKFEDLNNIHKRLHKFTNDLLISELKSIQRESYVRITYDYPHIMNPQHLYFGAETLFRQETVK